MIASANLISCNFLSFGPLLHPKLHHKNTLLSLSSSSLLARPPILLQLNYGWRRPISLNKKNCNSQICLSSISEDPIVEERESDEDENGVEGDGDGGSGGDWTTSILLFFFWAAIMYYVFNLAPNQTPSRDLYFVKKLSNLVGDDGFEMNKVLVSLWYIMGLWPIVYSMLLIPSGRSSKSGIPVGLFATLSFFGGAYVLLPYFIIWRPPPPKVKEGELSSWPLNFLESKLTAGFLGAVGLGLIVYAGLAQGDWQEFYQYFRESKLVHATSLDFTLLSAFAPFWVYNDMTARKCYDKTAWLLPFSIIPLLGPALYLLLRPPLTTMPVSLESTLKSD
ncbi:hypothetical protein BVRB_9g206100 [Beta vulgaris subsp. vulgaris]|uniref:Cardiolipin synthase N-terminal domain-containing protein n=1 Tax=Beta vulgaris subsp. vulgaris TaxID=3555 RepID=A0A0J8BM51_BETVV|nr:hypothetical protein BVRB_9g206100 [Beta vulgaris subsp. vulgaris]